VVQPANSPAPGTDGELMIENFGSGSVGEALCGNQRFQQEPLKLTLVRFERLDVETGNWFLSCALKVLAR
jgi:hypothetical protein